MNPNTTRYAHRPSASPAHTKQAASENDVVEWKTRPAENELANAHASTVAMFYNIHLKNGHDSTVADFVWWWAAAERTKRQRCDWLLEIPAAAAWCPCLRACEPGDEAATDASSGSGGGRQQRVVLLSNVGRVVVEVEARRRQNMRNNNNWAHVLHRRRRARWPLPPGVPFNTIALPPTNTPTGHRVTTAAMSLSTETPRMTFISFLIDVHTYNIH